MRFEKKMRKALGKLYTSSTVRRDEQLKEVIKSLSYKGVDYRVAVLLAKGTVMKRRQNDQRPRKLSMYGTPLTNPRTRVLNYWRSARDWESWRHVFIIKAGSEAQAMKVADMYINVGGDGCYCEHDCCGHSFHNAAWAKKLTSDRYIVSQTGGRNV